MREGTGLGDYGSEGNRIIDEEDDLEQLTIKYNRTYYGLEYSRKPRPGSAIGQ